MATQKSPVYIKAKDIAELVLEQKLVARFYQPHNAGETLLVVEIKLSGAGHAARDFVKRNCGSLCLSYIEATPFSDTVVFNIEFKHRPGHSKKVRDAFKDFQEISGLDELFAVMKGTGANRIPETWADTFDPTHAADVVDATESCTDVPHSVESRFSDTARELGLVAPGDVVALLSAPDFKYTVVADVDGSVVLAYKAESGEVKLTQAPLAVLTHAE